MEREIRILMLEDEPADAALIHQELNKSGISFVYRCVETEGEFNDQLQNLVPDVILSDHGLPGFDGFAALNVARNRKLDIPFIFVSGRNGEEDVVKSLKSGATDYVFKDRIADLVPAIRRALRNAEDERKRGEEIDQLRLYSCLEILFASSTRSTPAPNDSTIG